jgi:DNA mismatch endonuclease (patch repair protein)
MSQVRSKNTRIELTLRRALWAHGVRGWRCNVRSVFGTPDLLWKRRRLAVFVDSAWWHGHPSRWTPGKLSSKWDEKIARNRRRDEEVNRTLAAEGWTVIRIWDFELRRDLEACVSRIAQAMALEDPRRLH